MIDHSTNRRIVLAHDWIVGFRGGEWVLDRLARLFGPTDLYVLVDDGRGLSPAIDACHTITSPLQHLPGAAGRLRRFYLPLMPLAVNQLHVESCDLLISTSSAVMKSIRPPTGVPHLCYCHSPARYVWEQSADYAVGSGALLRRWGLRILRGPFQRWDRATASRVTKFLANSQHTAQRIKRCYDCDATVVYPPVRTEFFRLDENIPREEWFLVVTALEPYKRTDLVIEAAKQLGVPLKIVGRGSQAMHLAQQCNESIELLGRVDDEALKDLYQRARALIFPQVEDFGIIAVEAQATGCPVIAYAAGGAMESIQPDTGIFFQNQTVSDIIQAMKHLDQVSIDSRDCRQNAMRFSEDVFDQAILREVSNLLC